MERIELPLPCWGRTASPAHGAGPQVALEVQRIAGDAARPTMVFLHEGLGSVSMWSSREGSWPQSVCDAAGAPGIVFSRRGYGRSDAVADVRGAGRLPPDYMHREAFGVLPALLRALGIERPLLVGHSDGGTIALLRAIVQGERQSQSTDLQAAPPVAAVMVMAPHIMVEDLSIHSIERARQAYLHGDLRQRLARHHDDTDSAFWGWNQAWLSPAFRSWSIEARLHHIKVPVLAVQGHDDEYGTLEQIRGIARRVPHTELLELPACGHWPHRDQAQALMTAVAAFVHKHSVDR